MASPHKDFEFIDTPPFTGDTFVKAEPCGVRTTSYPTIHNAPLPADGPGSDTFSNLGMGSLLFLTPYYLSWKLGGGLKLAFFFALFTTIPILIGWWVVISSIAPRRNEKVQLPGRPIEFYLTFKKESDRLKYHGKNKIPMETFLEMYFDGDVEFNGDCLEVMEWRHDWCNYRFTWGMLKFVFTGLLPEAIMHTRSQDEEQVRDHYDRGDDFYGWFLGPRMVYTSGIISDPEREETLEEMQDNKMAVICEKIQLQENESLLDIGCGWGTLVNFASQNFKARATGITLGRNQTAWGNSILRKTGIPEDQSKILCMDYRDIPVPEGGFKKITCVEMAEHVGIRHFTGFLTQCYNMLDDDGIMFMQLAGLRKSWQYEDLNWGIFMNKYIFPGADASTPLGFYVSSMEAAGFEIKSIDTIGVHYSATLWRWYRNWMGNRDKVEAKYGKRWFRIWEYFLASSVITARQGGATCYQLTLVKNINSTHRVEGIHSQWGLLGAIANSRASIANWAARMNQIRGSKDVLA
ncbi:hypothetical protein TD95_003811 [Thielaviopsis punctulata]|uniref:sphingolipid C(9)-methyltransferase n=1 Tax=Thielaviopsis punctulata TaxID=72032 RepID=A0A0F4ZGJ6_9PEZI|nr:hypothetical protein TD95_003811 [Thielaviopsis punctulata]